MPQGVNMPHVSFSAFKNWDFCPFYHKLTYIDKLKGFYRKCLYSFWLCASTKPVKSLFYNNTEDYEKIFSNSFDEEIGKLEEITDERPKDDWTT